MAEKELAIPALGPSPLDFISPGQREKAEELAGVMAEHFDVYDSDFSIVHSPEVSGEPRFTVVYAVSEGLDLGNPEDLHDPARSWNEICGRQADDSDFLVELGGEEIDTRKGMTESVYRAMVAQIKDRCGPLPDRPIPFADGHGFHQPTTWLTGESAKPHSAPFGIANGGSDEADVWWTKRTYGSMGRLFRPAIALELDS